MQILSFPVDPDGALAAADSVTEFLMPALEERRREPRDDVLSHLLYAEYQGERFTDAEVVAHVRLLYSVGATTTSDSMSSMFWTLLNNPDLLARAQREPELRPRIVHESLRWEPPVALLPRIAPKGGEVAGVTVPEGGILLAALASANRDETVFANPDTFDTDREQGEFLTFGFGNKYCPGSHLARRQLLVALDVILDRLSNLRLIDADPPSGAILRRTEHLQVAWDAPA
jgi:cytochrome P450